jgi:hypothetical protein
MFEGERGRRALTTNQGYRPSGQYSTAAVLAGPDRPAGPGRHPLMTGCRPSGVSGFLRALDPGDVGNDVIAVRLVLAQRRDDPAPTEHHDPVHQIEDLPQVVADQDHRDAPVLQPADDVFDLRGFLHPKGRSGLVHDDQLRRKGRRSRNRNALPLAA